MISTDCLEYIKNNVIHSVPIPIGNGYITHAGIKDMAAEILAIRAKVAELEKERDSALEIVKSNAKELIVSSGAFKNGNFDVELQHPVFMLFALEMAAYLTEKEAPNYVELKFWSNDHGFITMTVQKQKGKTPHELRLAAESRAAAAEQQVAEMVRVGTNLANSVCLDLKFRITRENVDEWRSLVAKINPPNMGGPDDIDAKIGGAG